MNLIEKTKEYVKELFENEYSGHDYFHTERVYKLATTLALEEKADRLDAIGAIGIARCFMFGGHHNRILYDPDIQPNLHMDENTYRNHVSTTLNHFYEKLFLLKDMMNTESAKKMADKRHQVMQDYVDEFLLEWDGKL